MSYSSDSGTKPTRIDLTSQDLRTGTLRLPSRLQNMVHSGEVAAHDTVRGAVHQLSFEAPRDLSGLAAFFSTHELRPNDAVDLAFGPEGIVIAPYYRQRRRQSRGDLPANETGAPDGAQQELPEIEDTVRHLDVRENQPHSDNLATGRAQPRVPGTMPDGEPNEPLIARGDERSDSEGHEADSHTFQDPEPADDSGTSDTFLSEGHDYTEDRDPFLAFGEAPDPADYDPNPPVEAFPHKPGDARNAVEDPRTVQPFDELDGYAGEEAVHTPLHRIKRRPFGKPTFGRRNPVLPSVVVELRAKAQTESPPSANRAASSDRNSPQQPLWDDIDRTPRSRILGFLAQPDLPSVIQASKLAAELDLQLDETEAVLAELASTSDSRISPIRRDFYLVKRQDR